MSLQWVRYLEDGSVNYIECNECFSIYFFNFVIFHILFNNRSADAKQPAYLVTADDVDCYLAIEVQPLDDRKRKVYYFFLYHLRSVEFLYIILHLLSI